MEEKHGNEKKNRKWIWILFIILIGGFIFYIILDEKKTIAHDEVMIDQKKVEINVEGSKDKKKIILDNASNVNQVVSEDKAHQNVAGKDKMEIPIQNPKQDQIKLIIRDYYNTATTKVIVIQDSSSNNDNKNETHEPTLPNVDKEVIIHSFYIEENNPSIIDTSIVTLYSDVEHVYEMCFSNETSCEKGTGWIPYQRAYQKYQLKQTSGVATVYAWYRNRDKKVGARQVDQVTIRKETPSPTPTPIPAEEVNIHSFYIEENNPSIIDTSIVTLYSDVEHAYEMCFSNETSCEKGTGWIPYQKVYQKYQLKQTSGVATVYAWYRNKDKKVGARQVDQVTIRKETPSPTPTPIPAEEVNIHSFYIEENNPSIIDTSIVTLYSDVEHAYEMCFSNETSCEKGTGWIPYQKVYQKYQLKQTSGVATVYAWYRNKDKKVGQYQWDQVTIKEKISDDLKQDVFIKSFYIEKDNPSFIDHDVVTLYSDVEHAYEMCFSNETSCEKGTGWIPYRSIYEDYQLNTDTGKNTVYAWYRNGNKKVGQYQWDQVTVGKLVSENYSSVVDLSTNIYKNEDIISDMDELVSTYPNYAKKEKIGTSVYGRDIYAMIVGNLHLPKTSTKKILIIGNMHAREIQSAQIIMKQAEYYLRNMNHYYKDKKLADLFADAAIYFVPTTNPDGNEIVFEGLRMKNGSPACSNIWNCWGSGSVIDSTKYDQSTRFEWANKVEQAVTKKMKYYNAPDRDMRNDFLDGFHYKEYTNQSDVKFFEIYRYSDDYVYQDRHIVVWKSNANGVDLHNNFYEPGVNEDVIKTYVANNHPTSTKNRNAGGRNIYNTYLKDGKITGEFSTEAYVGASGISEPETIAIKNFIEANGIYEYAITYHGRSPIIYWDYTNQWEKNNHQLEQRKLRFQILANSLSNTSHIAKSVNTSGNGPLGFAGWYQQKYHGFGVVFEIGWSHWDDHNIKESFRQDSNGMYTSNKNLKYAYCPLEASQLPYIWQTQKHSPIELIYQVQSGNGIDRIYTN